jgi:hypothetical protein
VTLLAADQEVRVPRGGEIGHPDPNAIPGFSVEVGTAT